MVSSVHLLSAAAIATATNNWWWAILGPILMHYVLDVIPHWNPDPKKWPVWKYASAAAIDFSFGVALILWLLDWKISIMIAVAMLMGVLPDFIALFGFIFPNKILDMYNKWNNSIQIHTCSWFGFLSQVATLVIMVYVVYLYK